MSCMFLTLSLQIINSLLSSLRCQIHHLDLDNDQFITDFLLVQQCYAQHFCFLGNSLVTTMFFFILATGHVYSLLYFGHFFVTVHTVVQNLGNSDLLKCLDYLLERTIQELFYIVYFK
jgi:hypothetical protein